jgi:hypothetical protein
MGITREEMIAKITEIASKSEKFKIGETGKTLKERFALYGDEYEKIEGICWNKSKESIDRWEETLIEEFFGWENNENLAGGSAGKMVEESEVYWIYVVYTPKKESKKSKT